MAGATYNSGMTLSTIAALSPLDGRYAARLAPLRPLMSEMGFMHKRVQVEVCWFIALSDAGFPEFKPLSPGARTYLLGLVKNFSEADAKAIKDIEKTTNHDVKAVEYWIKSKFEARPELNTAAYTLLPSALRARARMVSPNMFSTVVGLPPILDLSFDSQAALADDPSLSAIRQLTLTLDVPQVDRQEEPFARMCFVATELARIMDGMVTDDHGQTLSQNAIQSIQQDLNALYDTLDARDLSAGSPQARRLFS